MEGLASNISSHNINYSLSHGHAAVENNNYLSESDSFFGDIHKTHHQPQKNGYTYRTEKKLSTSTPPVVTNTTMQTKIDRLREEKERLVRELYEDSNN